MIREDRELLAELRNATWIPFWLDDARGTRRPARSWRRQLSGLGSETQFTARRPRALSRHLLGAHPLTPTGPRLTMARL